MSLKKNLTTSRLIHNFKTLDILSHTELDEGMCTLTVFGEHQNHPEDLEKISKESYEKKKVQLFISK